MYTKKSGRTTYKTNRRPSFKKTGGYQNYKNRNKGNVAQQYNKYHKLAKEAFRSGDRIQSEYYYQFTDHYYRLMIELGINIDDNVQTDDSKSITSDDQTNENTIKTNDDNQEDNSNGESIESIPFIAEPSGEKKSKS